MQMNPAPAAVQSNMSTTQQLFKQIAPTYDATFILSHFYKKNADVEENVLNIRIAEFLKFIFLRSEYQNGFIPLKGEIDDIWHEFILQTHEYEKFCLALPGRKFIHHNSLHLEDFSKDKSKHEVVRDLMNWLPQYYRHFGPFAGDSVQYWLMVGFLQSELKLSLDEVNAVAKDAAEKIISSVN